MFQEQRCDKILEILKAKKNASIESLCKDVYCSIATMRRDLMELEKMGLVQRRRGGASIVTGANAEYSHTFRDMKNQKEKAYICSIADNFISNGFSIFLDSSSTVFSICPMLEKYNNISVVTNGIATAFSLAESGCADTYIAGGHIKSGSVSIVGEFSSEFIKNFKADLAILSCRGIDEQGTYEANQQQALVKQQMMKNAKSTIVLCDSSKFSQSYFYKLSGFANIEAVITDKKPDENIIKAIIQTGSDIMY